MTHPVRRRLGRVALALALLGFYQQPRAQGPACELEVQPTYGQIPGVTNAFGSAPGIAYASTVFDAGSGPAVYFGGWILGGGGQYAPYLTSWDGARWSTVNHGFNSQVFALTTGDLGGGTTLFAAGNFTSVGGVSATRIASWDGQTWSALGSGLNSVVRALAVFDDGNGPALYAAGSFNAAGGNPATGIARWDGASWSPLGSGTNGVVNGLAVHDFGGGAQFYAGGSFTVAGGALVANVASWDGASWSSVGLGVNGEVHSLASWTPSGGSPRLYAGGDFSVAGGAPAAAIAAWTGTSWEPLGDGLDDDVLALTAHDDGNGTALFAGGTFDNSGATPMASIARWDGTSWTAPDGGIANSGTSGGVHTLTSDTTGATRLLHVGGSFSATASAYLSSATSWDGTELRRLGDAPWGSVFDLAIFDDGSEAGPALYGGGLIRADVGGAFQSDVVRYDGGESTSIGDTLGGTIHALEVFDDGGGSGPELYVGGTFGGGSDNFIARFNGTAWVSVGPGMDSTVFDMLGFDDGNGPALYAGGSFFTAGTTNALRVARWDGASWSALGGGFNDRVFALATLDTGSGPELYAAGEFTTADGAPAAHVARWTGTAWVPLGTGLSGDVSALAAFDDGQGGGPALYVGGFFATAGGLGVSNVARWDGVSWSAVGSGSTCSVTTLEVADIGDGSGPALYASGCFVGGEGESSFARWDGTAWLPAAPAVDGGVSAFAGGDLGDGPALYVGGSFLSSTDGGDAFLARLTCPEPWVDLGGGTSGSFGVPELQLGGPLTAASLVDLDLVGGVPSTLALIFVSFTSAPTGFLGGTLHAFPFDELVVIGADGAGEIHGSALFPGASTGQGLWFQVGLADAGVPVHGASLSNGVKGTVP